MMRIKSKAGSKATRESSRFTGNSVRSALISSLALVLVGCPLPIHEASDVVYVSNDPEFFCTVTVANPNALGGTPQTSIISVPKTGPGINPDIVRAYYLANDCISGVIEGVQWGHASTAEVVRDWRRFYPRRMEQLAANATEASVLAAFPGGWCEVAGSAVCTRDGTIERCRSFAALTALDTELAACPPALPVPVPPVPGDPCLEIACGTGGATCTLISNNNEPEVNGLIAYGDVPVGAAPSHTMTLSHCGAAGDAPVEVIVDGTIVLNSTDADFVIPIPANLDIPQPTENGCYPPRANPNDPMDQTPAAFRTLSPGERCTFPVNLPAQWVGQQLASTTITSNARPDFRLELSANIQGGSLSFEADGAAVDVLAPAGVCVDNRVQGNCTRIVPVDVTNSGPGVITFSAINMINPVRFEPTDPRFEFDPPLPNFPVTLDSGQTRTFPFKWCGGANQEGDTNLVIESDDPNPDAAQVIIPVTRTNIQDGCP